MLPLKRHPISENMAAKLVKKKLKKANVLNYNENISASMCFGSPSKFKNRKYSQQDPNSFCSFITKHLRELNPFTTTDINYNNDWPSLKP